MKIAVEGCAHGELDKIYEAIQLLEKENSVRVDLLIICGDFQAVRNPLDLQCMAVPPKYRKLNTFYKYYSGAKKAPILTIFVGGNHEASNYLSELPYGGWVCPNIYYLGYANVINIGGIRIAGLSGIYKGRDYLRGHFECPPYDESAKKSVYHVRNIDVFRLKQIKNPIDIFISHDWPTGVYNFGNKADLLKWKPFFKEEMENNSLGSPAAEELLMKVKPSYWFAAHLHCKFAAVIPHNENGNKTFTRFLALDKCLPRRKFLQVIEVESDNGPFHISYDPEWLCILNLTNHLLSVSRSNNYMPGNGCSERWNFSPSENELENIHHMFNNDFKVPDNFSVTAPCYDPSENNIKDSTLRSYVNPQTEKFCKTLNITDPLMLLTNTNAKETSESSFDPNEIKLSDDSDDEPETTNPDLDISGCSDFFIDKIGSHSSKQNSNSSETYSFPEIKEDCPKTDSTEVNLVENPLKKFKRRNYDLYKSEDADL